MAAEERRRRILLAGDAEGNLTRLFGQAVNQQKRVGNFDALLSAGAFLPGVGEGAKEAAAALATYVSGKEEVPMPTYFVESRSAAILQAAPEGKTLCDKLHFLGGFGIRDIGGLRVAYLSGRYDAKVYESQEAGEDAPAFVGAAYTRKAVKSLIELAKKSDSPAIDVFLTAEWPARIEDKLDEPERPKHPEGLPFDWTEVSSTPVAELCAALEPRYHVFATADIFYQRPPFQTPTRGHVCRCVALGKVGSKGKARVWVHGLSLSPASEMTDAQIKQRPENTTPCPFLGITAAENGGVKRAAEEMNDVPAEDGPAPVPNEVFIGRLPPNIDEKRIQKALKACGTIERVHLARDESEPGKPCKGFGWVTFSTPEEAEAACDLNDLLECGNRKISIQISRPRLRADGSGGPPRKKREVQIVVEPHAECWFCLVNPSVEKHMIVSATTEVYVATARGPISPPHVLVLPVKHAPCYAACPPELQEVLTAHVSAIRKMCQASKQECLVWERWIPQSSSGANHMQIQVLPIEQARVNHVRDSLEAITRRDLVGASLKRVTAHNEVIDHLGDDSGTPYIYFEIPGDNTAKGRQIERYVYAGKGSDGGPRIPLDFGRKVACHLLNCEDKVDWKQCQEDHDAEKRLAKLFREQFKPFQPR